MELYLLRHGIAEDAKPGMSDESRKLTPEGEEKLAVTLCAAARAGVRPTLILTSPLVRAVQTAEIAARELGYSGELVRTKSLVPEADPRDVWADVRTHRSEEQLLLASHNPLCSALPGYLVGFRGLQVEFRKGALMRIDFGSLGPEPRGVLQWLLTAKLAGA